VGFEVPTAVYIKMLSRVTVQISDLLVSRRFIGTCCMHLLVACWRG